MKILYCGAFRFPTGDAAASRVLNNAKIIKSLGHEVEFIAFGGKQIAETYQGFKYNISHDIDLKWSWSKIKSLFCSGYKTIDKLKDSISKYDAIIIYNPSTYFTAKMISLCSRHSVKLIVDATEWYSHRDFPLSFFNPFFYIYSFGERHVKTRIKNAIPISRYLFNHFEKSKTKIILPPLVDLTEEKWSKSAPSIKPFDGVTLIYAGNAGNKKDRIDIVLEALDQATQRGAKLRLLILGSTKVLFRDEAQQERLQHIVEFLGRVPQDEVPSYYKLADFSVLIRDVNRKSNAGFSTKLVESIAAGVPPIVNKTSNIEDYLIDSKNSVLLNTPSAEELTDSFLKINNWDTERLTALSEKVKELAYTSFHYESYKKQMSDFLENLE